MGERQTPRAAAIFIFNHKYEKNIEKLEEIYSARFLSRQYVMPFSKSENSRVIGIYENSWNFGGHIAQAGKRITLDPAITHYAFIADDLILNPKLDESSLLQALELGPETGYIKSLASADALRYRWPWAGETAMSIRKFGRGFDWRSELPPANLAQEKFEELGLRFPFPIPRSIREIWYGTVGLAWKSPWAFAMGLGMTGRRADYPILSGYADFVVVPASKLNTFTRYCGIFSAMNIFAEVAVPTAFALAVQEIKTELPLGRNFMDPMPPQAKLRGVEFWQASDSTAFAEKFKRERDVLLKEFPPDWLYVHPVKLSQWK